MSEDLLPQVLDAIRRRTPARLFLGRAGAGYSTSTQLELRAAHAAARDAVRSELNLQDLGRETIEQFGIFEICSVARSKEEYILRPDLGRRLSEESRRTILEHCQPDMQIQFVVGDGLSTTAVAAQVPLLLPLLFDSTRQRGWKTGRPFAVRFCRVGILNDVGELLRPQVAVLLIGERPGLATAESLSAYMAFRPRAGHTDAHRNLISNIHRRGVCPSEAAVRIIKLAEKMMAKQLSGAHIHEEFVKDLRPAITGGEAGKSQSPCDGNMHRPLLPPKSE
jgi:ethanolamine ammonia-lyase small subunit